MHLGNQCSFSGAPSKDLSGLQLITGTAHGTMHINRALLCLVKLNVTECLRFVRKNVTLYIYRVQKYPVLICTGVNIPLQTFKSLSLHQPPTYWSICIPSSSACILS